MFRRLAFLTASMALAAHAQHVGDMAAIADNMKKFTELYGIATRMMNLGGTILSSASGSGGGGGSGSSVGGMPTSSYSSSASNNYDRNYFKDDNRLQSDLDAIPTTSIFGFGKMAQPSTQKPSSVGSLFGLGDYGGGPLGGGTQSAQRTGLESLMNMFLGTGVTEPPSRPSLTSFFSPSNDYMSSATDYGSIDKLISTLMASGAKPASRADPNSMQALLGQFFGTGKRK